ncbi:MAG: TIGR03088 family PEP-CTERM/XrtA system glycosyltransferase [Hahellaceae bacterium]|nr:TIGR03088 family PEP-CTERM/XrtA system glycosyltransferase [Hahellaceae bacterium]
MSDKVLIAHVLHRFDVGGLENGLVNLINRLPADEFDHAIVTMEGFNPEFAKRLNRDIPIYSADKKPGKDFGVYIRLYKILRKIKPLIVHSRNLGAIEAQLPALLAGAKFRVHGEHGWDVYDPKGEVKKYQQIRRVFSLLIHRFVPLSKELENYLLKKVGVPQRKIKRICNGVDLSRFSCETHSRPDDWPFDLNDVVFGCVGRLEPIKGHMDLLEAFQRLHSRLPEKKIKLCLVGDGSQRERLALFVKENGLQEVVYFAGNRRDIPELMSVFDCFVLPSHAEGISNTILEAMASGLPVLATRVGGNEDLVEEDVTGVLVEARAPEKMADAMQTLAENAELRKNMSSQGKRRVHDFFSLQIMVDQYADLYRSLP